MVAADLADREQAIRAVAGSSVVYLVTGLKYDHRVWHDLWPRIMANTIEACKRAQSKLLSFDNVYMYGKVNGPMTEETPYTPCSKKGEIRAKIAVASTSVLFNACSLPSYRTPTTVILVSISSSRRTPSFSPCRPRSDQLH